MGGRSSFAQSLETLRTKENATSQDAKQLSPQQADTVVSLRPVAYLVLGYSCFVVELCGTEVLAQKKNGYFISATHFAKEQCRRFFELRSRF